MIDTLPMPRVGDTIKAEHIAAISRALKKRTPRNSPTVKVHETADGFSTHRQVFDVIIHRAEVTNPPRVSLGLGRLKAEKSKVIEWPSFRGLFDEGIFVKIGGREIRGDLGDERTSLAFTRHIATKPFIAIARTPEHRRRHDQNHRANCHGEHQLHEGKSRR